MQTVFGVDIKKVLECQACLNRVEFSVSAVEHRTWHVDKHGDFEEAAGACEDSTKGDDYMCRHCDSFDVTWVNVCKGCECLEEFCVCAPSVRRDDFHELTQDVNGIRYEEWVDDRTTADPVLCIILRPSTDTPTHAIAEAMRVIKATREVERFAIDRVPNAWYGAPVESQGN